MCSNAFFFQVIKNIFITLATKQLFDCAHPFISKVVKKAWGFTKSQREKTKPKPSLFMNGLSNLKYLRFWQRGWWFMLCVSDVLNLCWMYSQGRNYWTDLWNSVCVSRVVMYSRTERRNRAVYSRAACGLWHCQKESPLPFNWKGEWWRAKIGVKE